MAKRHPNYRLVKLHRTYSVHEIARLFGKHRNTVRRWLKDGLATIDSDRPILVRGPDLIEFLKARRAKNKRSCRPGEIYCVGCRAPRTPAGDIADYSPISESSGNLIGICPVCDGMIYRRTSSSKIDQVRGNLLVAFPQAGPHIVEAA